MSNDLVLICPFMNSSFIFVFKYLSTDRVREADRLSMTSAASVVRAFPVSSSLVSGASSVSCGSHRMFAHSQDLYSSSGHAFHHLLVRYVGLQVASGSVMLSISNGTTCRKRVHKDLGKTPVVLREPTALTLGHDVMKGRRMLWTWVRCDDTTIFRRCTTKSSSRILFPVSSYGCVSCTLITYSHLIIKIIIIICLVYIAPFSTQGPFTDSWNSIYRH